MSPQTVSRLLRAFPEILVLLQGLRISEGNCAPPMSVNAASARSGRAPADGLFREHEQCGADHLSIFRCVTLEERQHTFADSHTPEQLLPTSTCQSALQFSSRPW